MTTYEKDQHPRAHRTHLSAAGLRARGWTAGMVRRLLGEPDLRRANPFFRTAPPTRLYSVERVEAAERSEEFRAVSAVAVRRSGAVREAVLRRRREILARIAAEPIDVPVLAPEELTALAVEHRERLGGSTEFPLEHWKVDYLCHRPARYDDILDELSGGTGRAAAEQLLRRRILASVSQAYPDLAQECAHLAHRSGPEIEMRPRPSAPDDRKVARRSPQEPT
ncbi:MULTISPECIES: hypothetical protein [unclassified Streptomyces]|uniref:hypothetical protein n=1 Tax=unclassified Streptomyces TaxID=2593676 RepID=UPI0024732DF2|nr:MULTISPECIES: hypothetical protein [unclassified Streptomyces]MDH6449175.1 hypothetical protein [Streptomyces sp. SAI-119]MDH6500246.1 hypothetical protein [Streptomyces sp. SAI-149]